MKRLLLYIVLLLFVTGGPGAAPSFAMPPVMEDDISKEEILDDIPSTDPGILGSFKKRIRQIWHSDTYDIYIPAYTWHNRLTYSRSKIRKYNENPWGGGIGKSFKDKDGDRHYLFVRAFRTRTICSSPMAGMPS